MRLISGLGCLALAATGATGAEPLRLENTELRVTVDPRQGGAVTEIFYKRAMTFPLIADKGAGVAGSGCLFAPVVAVAGRTADWADARVVAASASSLSLTAPGGAPGLTWQRTFRLAAQECGWAMEDVLRNDSDQTIAVEVGASSVQRAENWRLADRTWIGNGREVLTLAEAKKFPRPAGVSLAGSRLFWRQIEQYGTGFLYRVPVLPAAATMTADVRRGPGNAVQTAWRSGVTNVPAHGTLMLAARIDVDEGGGPPDGGEVFAPVLVRSDLAAAGRSGQPLLGFATVVSPRARRVRVAVATDRELTHSDLELVPGKVARIPVTVVPAAKGELAVRVTVTEGGQPLGGAESRSVIDGTAGDAVWRTYSGRMPEEYYRGTWTEIGAQLARDHHRLIGSNTIEIRVGDASAPENGLRFYRKHFPYYAELLTGMAPVVGAAPTRLFLSERAGGDRMACMDVACYGPDGPINAFSKERGSTSFKGLGYLQVHPAQGYPFHIYMHCGINAAGLSISSATLNEDEHTDAVELKALDQWKLAGKQTLPPIVGVWMLLAMCRNVDEAIAMIDSTEAPLELEGSNMLLLDRSGAAARVESVGIEHRVYRRPATETGFFIAGNYPHEGADGLFKLGENWGWAANTQLREQFLRDYAGARQGHLSLPEVVSLMQTHEAGGMCQHIYDNAGQLYTTCSFIAVTRTGDLWLSEGPPSEIQYIRHSLAP